MLYNVDAEGTVLPVLHLWGSAYERGFAQGQLIGDQVVSFRTEQMVAYFRQNILDLKDKLKHLPVWEQKLIEHFILDPVSFVAVDLFDIALDYVYAMQHKYIEASPAKYFDEIKGITDGICALENHKDTDLCKEGKLEHKLQQINMLPDLVRMQCSFMGAWGAGTADGDLLQYRTLDFGGGPFANNNVLTVHHPDDSKNTFASVSFPGFVGIVTGFSDHLAISEIGDAFRGVAKPGTYKGIGDVFTERDIVQFADNIEDFERIGKAAKRTWAIFLGVGEVKTRRFKAMLYDMEEATLHDDTDLYQFTN